MNIETIKKLMDAFYQGKRIREMLPPLPEGVKSSDIYYIDKIETLERSGIQVKVSDISDFLNLSRPGVTRAVNEMVQKGFLEKQPSKEDGRVVYISVTEKGRGLSAIYNDKAFRDLVPYLESISQEEAETTIKTIEKFYNIMNERRKHFDK